MSTRSTGGRLAGVVAALAVAVGAAVQIPTAQAARTPIDCVAHRGGADSGATEETTGAYDYGMRHGVIMVEGDLRFSATGYPFLLHDRTLGAFGAPEVALADISGTQASTYTSPSGGRIASLTEIVGLLRGFPGVSGQLELKETPTAPEWSG